jgi:hypothetical protein
MKYKKLEKNIKIYYIILQILKFYSINITKQLKSITKEYKISVLF